MMKRLALLSTLILAACSSSTDASPNDPALQTPRSTQVTAGDAGTVADGPSKPKMVVTRVALNLLAMDRFYYLAVPSDYDAKGTKTYPLVVVFHGSPGTAQEMVEKYPYDAASGTDAIIAYPNSFGSGWDLYSANEDNPDMAFVHALPADIANHVRVDTRRVYGAGWSGGAFFVTQFTCRYGGIFKGIGVYAGGAYDDSSLPTAPGQFSNGCSMCPGGPVPTIVVHGEADTTVPHSSGEYAAGCWSTINHCSTTRSASTPAPCESYDNCTSGAVSYCSLPGVTHDVFSEGVATAWGRSWTFFNH